MNAPPPYVPLNPVGSVAVARNRTILAIAVTALLSLPLYLGDPLMMIRAINNDPERFADIAMDLASYMPNCMGYFMPDRYGEIEPIDGQQPTRLSRVADTAVVLGQAVVQVSIVRRIPCYDTTVIDVWLEPAPDLAGVLSAIRSTAERK